MQCAFESAAVIVPPGTLAGADEAVTVGCGAPAVGGFVAAPDELSAVAGGDADAEPDGDGESDGDGDAESVGDAEPDGNGVAEPDGDAGSGGGRRNVDGDEGRDCGGDGWLDGTVR